MFPVIELLEAHGGAGSKQVGCWKPWQPQASMAEKKRKERDDGSSNRGRKKSKRNDSRDGHISIEDLLNPLSENPGYAKLRKRSKQIEKNARTIYAPLPKADQAKIDRKVAYEISKKQVTKWQPIIQRNREARTIVFDEKLDVGFSTIGAIASKFEPRTEFQSKIAAALAHYDQVMEAHKKDGSRLLEMNKVVKRPGVIIKPVEFEEVLVFTG